MTDFYVGIAEREFWKQGMRFSFKKQYFTRFRSQPPKLLANWSGLGGRRIASANNPMIAKSEHNEDGEHLHHPAAGAVDIYTISMGPKIFWETIYE